MRQRLILGLGLLALMTACDGDSPAPAPTPIEPSIVAVTISGPSLMQPGESSQFSATARLSDGSNRNVTETAVWRTSNASVFNVTAAGLVTALIVGEGSISVNYQGRNPGVFVTSLPAGTGILFGDVREAGFPIAGATIEVVGGPFAGRSVMSEGSGFYKLFGVVGALQIRASKEGYVALTKPVTVAPLSTPRRDQTLDFNLSLSGPALALAGSYRVSLAASTTCGSRLPAAAVAREYLATVTQDGSLLTIVLSGAEFAVSSSGATINRFEGRVRPDSVELSLGGDLYYYAYYDAWGFVERLLQPPIGSWGFSETGYLGVIGTARGPATPSTISATLDGILSIHDAPRGFAGPRRRVSFCSARDHRLTLTRQ